jgi:hypothetical protein
MAVRKIVAQTANSIPATPHHRAASSPKRGRVGRGTPSACSAGSLHRADGRAGVPLTTPAGRAVRDARVEVTCVLINSKRSRRRCHGARGASHIDLAVGRVDGPGDLTGRGKSRDFEKTAMKWARCRKHGRVRSMGYGRAPVEERQRNDDQSTFPQLLSVRRPVDERGAGSIARTLRADDRQPGGTDYLVTARVTTIGHPP